MAVQYYCHVSPSVSRDCHQREFWSRDLSLRFSKFDIYELSYNFNTVLYQFIETGTLDKTFTGHDHELK